MASKTCKSNVNVFAEAGRNYQTNNTALQNSSAVLSATCFGFHCLHNSWFIKLEQTWVARYEGFKLQLLGEGNLRLSSSYYFDASASKRYSEKDHRSGGEHPKEHEEIPASQDSKAVSLGAHLKCCCACTCSQSNKQEELKTRACFQGYEVIGITETWQDGSHDCWRRLLWLLWSVAMGMRAFWEGPARDMRRGCHSAY